MTKKYMNWKSNSKPFLLKPAGKDYLWGGNRLNDDFAKNIELTPLAETWECSTHPDGPSIVDSGEYQGKLLPDVLEMHPEFLGEHLQDQKDLPILIKLIDAKKDLSIQVHPDDAYAQVYEGSKGKSEMWYVLDAAPGASLVYGFSNDVSEDVLRESISEGTLEKYLQKIQVHRDDVYYIEAGTVHAIGAGALIAEIQENSNITYRLYDYNRVDSNGNLRELHIDKALAVANRKSSTRPRQPMRVLKYRQGCASELLCRCQYFEVERQIINTERCRQLVPFQTGSDSFQVLLCTKGCGILVMEDGDYIEIFKGDCVFVPANSMALRLHGKMQLLKVRC